jgi:DNA polymerase III subunit epsilon
MSWYVARVNRSGVPPATSTAGSGFRTLRDEAFDVLRQHQDGLTASDLAEAVFGTDAGSRWAALLPSVLGDDDRMEYAEGLWRPVTHGRRPATTGALAEDSGLLSSASPADELAAARTILTLALSTTGADPRRHRIARIGLVRVEAGKVTARFDEVVTSGRRLAGYLKHAGHVADDDLNEARSFGDLVPRLLEMVDGDAVYVYGAERARAFIEAELRRADLPGLSWRLVEIDGILRSLIPSLSKPGLKAATAELGLPGYGRSAPLAEAELAARVIGRLQDRLGASPARPIMDDACANDQGSIMPFTRAWLGQVPDCPGVYLFQDADGITLYVGKAASLRRRLADYVRRQPSLHRGFEALGVRTVSVATVLTPSDLEAALLEARVIRERQPAFNVARAVRGPATIVRAATDGRGAGVRLVERAAPDGARYFGPFESVSAARSALSLARVAYPAAFPRHGGDTESRRDAVLGVCRLLAGQREPTIASLRERMRTAAEAGDRIEVDRLRAAIRDVQAMTPRYSETIGRSEDVRLLLLERLWEGGPGRLHLVQAGRLLASATTDVSALPSDAGRLAAFADTTFGAAADDTTVARPVVWAPEDAITLRRWIAQARARLEIRRLQPGGPTFAPCRAKTGTGNSHEQMRRVGPRSS